MIDTLYVRKKKLFVAKILLDLIEFLSYLNDRYDTNQRILKEAICK